MTQFALSYEEKRSPLWKKLCAHWETRLESLHSQNEGDKTDIETAKLRGRMAELRLNMALNKEPIKE